MKALQGAHLCNIDEMRVDHNDGVRTFILDTLLLNIRKHSKAYKEDMQNERTILYGQNIEPSRKLALVKHR